MERKKKVLLKSRKKERRSLLKNCFANKFFSFVPFEIWRDIVCFANPKSTTLLAQTCWGFKELVENAGENNLNLALSFRREGQIDIARKYLMKCASNNNSIAMFHLGYACSCGGFGFKKNRVKALSWFENSAENGNAAAMAFLASSWLQGCGKNYVKDECLSLVWAKTALSSNDSFALGYCHKYELGTVVDERKAIAFFEVAASSGNEFAQEMLGSSARYGLSDGSGKSNERAYYWFLKSAEQGLILSQYFVGHLCLYGQGTEKDVARAVSWFKKAARQGDEDSLYVLRGL